MKLEIKQRINQLNNGEIPNGYKKTEFGVFPCDWETEKTFGDLFEFYGGLSKSRDELGDEGYPYLHYGDLHRGSFNRVSYEQYKQLPKCNITLTGKETCLMEDGDVAFLDASEDLEGTSRAVLIDNPDNKPFIAGLHIIYGKSKDRSLEKWFKQYITSAESTKKQFQKLASGFKVYGLNRDTLPKIHVAYPATTQEQSRISEILMKWDKAIELQEKYIEKLEYRKKYLSSRLLNIDYKKAVSLQDLIDRGYARLIKPKELPVFEGERLYLSTSSIVKNEIVGNEGYISFFNRPSRAQMYPIANSVWFAKMENSIKVYKFNNKQQEQYILSTGYYGFLCNEKKLSSDYLMQVFLSPGFNRMKNLYSEGSSQNGIKDNNLSDILLSLPSITKQHSIAIILFLADNEIFLQKEKLEKIKKQRKAIQQYLLNGIVRV